MKYLNFNIFLIVIVYFSTVPCALQGKEIIKSLSNRDGLSNNSVNCIFEDSYKTLWIGTWDGLNAYNGNSIKTYRFVQGDSLSISNNIIRDIIQIDEQSLWVSTDFGINKWDYQKEVFSQYYLGTKDKGATHEAAYIIQQDASGNLYSYISNEGFYRYNKRTDAFDKLEVSFDQHITDFVIKEQTLFFHFKDSTVGYIDLDKMNPETKVKDLVFIDNFAGLDRILKTADDLVVLFYDYFILYHTADRSERKIVYDNTKKISAITLNDEQLYIATEQGLEKYLLEHNQLKFSGMELQGSMLTYIYQGGQDILWIGSDGQGIFQKYSDFSSFNVQHTSYPTRAFSQFDPQFILIGTKGGGINLFDRKTETLHSFADSRHGLLSNSVYCFTKTRSGDIFIGSDGNGLNYIRQGERTIKSITTTSNYPFLKSVYALHFSDNDSILWIGTAGNGLLKGEIAQRNGQYLLTNVIQFATSDQRSSIKNNIIYTIEEDGKGNIWFGTRGAGVYIIQKHSNQIKPLKEVYPSVNLTNEDILSLHYNDGMIWIGTSYGLNCLKINGEVHLTTYTTNNGLKNNTIHGTLNTPNGDIWISTNAGLSKLSGTTIVNYTRNKSLQSNEFSDGSYFQSTNGDLYFGGVNGFNFFDPSQIHFRDYKPQLEIGSLSIYNVPQVTREVIKNGVLKLSYDKRFITLSFISKEFIDNASCEYAYRIKNESREWVLLGTSPHITFSNLTPGRHFLEVKNTNGDKVWNDEIYPLTIQVAYPWWFSTTAILVYVFFLIAIAWGTHLIIRNRIRLSRRLFVEQLERKMQQETHEQKLDFFTNVAHEFFTPLTLIYTPAQYLIDNIKMSPDTKKYIHIIKNNAERLQKLITELMEFRKAKSGYTSLRPDIIDLDFLIDYIIDNYIEVFQENRIELSIDKKNLGAFCTDKSSLEKILLNLISNAYKYTPRGGNIRIKMELEAQSLLHFSIRNSGSGLTPEKIENIFNKFEIYNKPNIAGAEATGIGLHLTKSLIELLGGSISVRSEVGEYTQFDFTVVALSPQEKPIGSTSDEPDEANMDTIPQLPNRIEGKKMKILLVEDEKHIRELVKAILLPYYEVAEAVDGVDAYNQLAVGHPDLLITDIMMPNMDGYQLIKTLKSDTATAYIPIIALSAKSSMEDHVAAYDDGADLYLPKPFHPSYLLSVVNNILKKQDRLKEYFNSPLSSEELVDGLRMHNEEAALLKKIVDYIYQNLDDEQLSVDSISNYLAISKSSLYRSLKEINNHTPSELIRSIRLEQAAKMLTTTQMTVSEIILKCGFTNRSYFYKEFFKKFGVTPSQYRTDIAKKND